MTPIDHFLHAHNFLNKPTLAEDGRELSLFHDEINSVYAHGIVETNVSNVVVHASKQCCKPLLSVTRPNAAEVPSSALGLEVRAKAKLLNSTCKVGDIGVDFTIG